MEGNGKGRTYNSLSHLLIVTRPLRRHVSLLLDLLRRQFTLLIIPAFFGRHFAREVSRCNTVDAHAGLFKLRAHKLGQVHGRPLSGVVAEMPLAESHDAAHGGDVDDVAGVTVGGVAGGLEEGEERHA